MGKKIQCIGKYVMDGVVLGKGNFARVELATHSVTACKVAIKIIDTRKIKEDYVKNNLHREARILGQLRHPNIIRLYETLKATTLYCLVLECASGGNLLSYIKTFKDLLLPEEKARPYVRQLVSAVHYLHERGVSHRDLKMENIMLDEKKKNIKIVDFGLSNTFTKDELMKTHCGSPEYAAPELLTSTDRYGPEIDVWSIGVILYAVVVGHLPFTTPYTDQYRRQKLMEQIEKGLVEQHEREMQHISHDCRDLLRKLLEPCPEKRMALSEVENHVWITYSEKPFAPFHAFPKNKTMKSQESINVSESSSGLDVQVLEELSSMLSINKEQIEKSVKENKCDEIAAMFNMILDNKRMEKGVYDVDYTLRQEKPNESKNHKHKKRSTHAKLSQAVAKLEANARNSEVSPKTDGSPREHEHKVSASFDFMALCSAPTWLGHEKRRSRRRINRLPTSPTPGSEHGMSNDGLNAQNDPSNPNFLSPGQPVINPYNRRSFRRSSSRRKKRSSSYGPMNRRATSLKDTGASCSQPNSPTAILSPSIRIDPPRPTPVPRPKALGVTECYNMESPVLLHVPTERHHCCNHATSPAMAVAADGAAAIASAADPHHHGSDSSNPCSTVDLLSIEGSYDNLNQSHDHIKYDWLEHDSEGSGAKLVFGGDRKKLKDLPDGRCDSVEARIASVDIKSLVRPKQLSALKHSKKKLADSPSSFHKVMGNSPLHKNEQHKNDSCLSLENISMQARNEPSLRPYVESCDLDSGFHSSKKRVQDNIVESISLERNPKNLNLMEQNSQDKITMEINCAPTYRQLPKDLVEVHQSINETSAKQLTTCEDKTLLLQPNHKENVKFSSNSEYRNDQNSACLTFPSQPASFPTVVPLSQPCPPNESNSSDFEVNTTSKTDLLGLKHTRLEPNTSASISSGVNKSILASKEVSKSDKPLKSQDSSKLSKVELSSSKPPPFSPASADFSPDVEAYLEGKDAPSNPNSSNSLYKLVMPSTPTRQMFKTPLARIESFHSQDFEVLSSELDSGMVRSTSTATTPSSAVNTPTVPCFGYKLHLHKKKNGRLKSEKMNSSLAGKEMEIHKDSIKETTDICGSTSMENGTSRHEGVQSHERLSEVDLVDKSTVSKAKIHPMDKDEENLDVLRSGKANSKAVKKPKCTGCVLESTGNDIKSSSKQGISSSENLQTGNKSFEKDKASTKKSPWKRGFVHFLRRKRQHHGYQAGSRNNNEQINSSYHLTNNRNGHSCYGKMLVPAQENITPAQMETQFTSSTLPTFSDSLDICPSPGCGTSPSPTITTTTTKVYDFTVITADSPQAKSCLLSWSSCRECTFSDEQLSEEGRNEAPDVDESETVKKPSAKTSSTSCESRSIEQTS